MCGIAGIVYPPGHRADVSDVQAMINTLRHRGPDAQGTHAARNVALGHRRLSIIDTREAANQPMFNDDGSVAVVFNGEIYNYRTLAAELESHGHQLRTSSDTEVILRAWEHWGESAIQRLRGMFAFAVYDSVRERILVARDRLGQKPLYYTRHEGTFAFASEIKALRQFLGASSAFDCESIADFITFGYSVGSRTIYPDIQRLEPAQVINIDTTRPEQSLDLSCYWEVNHEPMTELSQSDWLDRLDEKISESVRLRLMSDVPLGAFLSGGVDSSLIVAYMTRHAREPVKTFTIGFSESTHDESHYARAVADHLGVEHRKHVVKPDAIEVLDYLIEAFDEPFGDESAIPTYYLCQAAKQHVTVALSGDGGDEMFSGYARYGNVQRQQAFGTALSPLGRWMIGQTANQLPMSSPFRRILQRQSQSGSALYQHALGYSTDRMALLHCDVRQQLNGSGSQKMIRDFQRVQTANSLDRYGDVDLRNYLPENILAKVDRTSMQHSLEVRCPLLDHKFVELAHQIPVKYKRRWGRGKILLRKLLKRHLPNELVDRPKMGFGVPLARWFRGDLKSAIAEMLADQRSTTWQWLDHKAVAACVTAHQSGRVNLQASLWRCLYFYRWIQHLESKTEALPCQRIMPTSL